MKLRQLIMVANALDESGLFHEANVLDQIILFARESVEHIEDVSGWELQPGTKLGTNDGGVYVDRNGKKYYVKFPANEEQARQEVGSSKIHEKLGVKTLQPRLIRLNGKVGTATEWRDDLKTKKREHFEELDENQARAVARMHHAGVLTKNWDTVGLEHDNIMFHEKTGEPHAVDQGGSFNFRAQGGHKEYGDDIGEVSSYRNPRLNESAAHVFSHVFSKSPHIEKEELAFARKLSRDDVYAALKSAGVKDLEKMTDTFMKRRDLLLRHYDE